MKSLKRNTFIAYLILSALMTVSTGQQDSSKAYRLSLPGKSWLLEVPLSEFSDISQQTETYVRELKASRGLDKKQHPVILNIRMEPAKIPGDAQALRDSVKTKLRKNRSVAQESLKLLLHNEIPLMRYSFDASQVFSPQTNDFPKMKVLEAYYVKDEIWITVRMNFFAFNKEDESFFLSFVDSLKFVDRP
jgi:hypothetical protein